MRDCIFQYATERKIYEDTDLITKEEAEALWEKYLPKFKAQILDDDTPEMAIWINMASDTDFKETSKYFHYSDFEVIDGQVCSVIAI